MEFEIGLCDQFDVKDNELSELLHSVYVKEGYTSLKLANSLFKPSLVRDRGTIFVARESSSSNFAGMVIVVPPSSSAKMLAKSNECEIHLLGVKPQYRGFKLGKNLVETALAYVKENNWSKIILWTQKSMVTAQNLYKSCGFVETGKMSNNEIDFVIYEKNVT